MIDVRATSNHLRDLMSERGLEPKDLTKACHTDRKTIYKWLNGQLPSIDNLLVISNLMEVTVNDIIVRKEQYGQTLPLYLAVWVPSRSKIWEDEDFVIQVHPPKSLHVNLMPNCLHLWRPLDPALLEGLSKVTLV